MKVLVILLLLCGVCFQASLFADEVINEKYSYQAFPYHGLSFKDRPAEEFNNTVVAGACFYQEWVEGDKDVVKDIFPDGMTGVVFRGCNLDNVLVPVGNTVEGGINRKIAVQNDWSAWILDDNLQPIEPLYKELRLSVNVSCDPQNIPAEKWTEKEREEFEENLFSIIVTP